MRAELLLTATRPSVSRYRRRILAIGFALALVLVGVGAPVYLRGIERDLERRVPAELAAAGVADLTATFSGQEGVLRCPRPLSDPEAILRRANDVDGVTVVTLDRSCRVSSAPSVTPGTTTAPSASSTEPPPSSASPSTTASDGVDEAGSSSAAEFDTVGELLRSGSRFSLFARLVDEAGRADVFDGAGPVTVFAPDNAAFDELMPDVLAEIRSDPGLLADVIDHHVIATAITRAELTTGELTTLGGGMLAVSEPAGGVAVEGASIVGAGDLVTGNGVVHGVDRVLLPEDLSLRSLADLPEFVVVQGRGTLGLSGTVGSELDRVRLLGAARGALDPVNVTDEIDVDPDDPLDAGVVDALVELVSVLPATMVDGSLSFDGSVVRVRGTVLDADARSVLDDIATRPGVVVDLVDRPVATADDAGDLQAELSALLAEAPLEFAPNSADLEPGSLALLDVLAATTKRFAGLVVTVEGHTDTAGNPQTNLELSEFRAAVVYLELVRRGVPVDQLDFVGRGGESPIVIDGVEDADASRRVELVVERID